MPIAAGRSDRDVFVRRYSGAFTDEELEATLVDMTRVMEAARREHRKIVLLSIGESGASMHSKQRSRVADWTTNAAPLMRAAVAAHAVVVPNAVQRGVLTAILWLTEYPIPIRAFTSEGEAEQWIRAQVPGAVAARQAS
jgi:hypothetical protein